MPLYVAAQSLEEVVARLAESTARSSLTDYLIFKRALKLAQLEWSEASKKAEESVQEGTTSLESSESAPAPEGPNTGLFSNPGVADATSDAEQQHTQAQSESSGKQQGASKQPPSTVVTGLRSANFVRAIEEMTMVYPPSSSHNVAAPHPYYLPFGAKRDTSKGYRTKKYPSNGSSDTVSRWQSRAEKPLILIPNTSPKEFKFADRSDTDLANFFNVATQTDSSGRKPSLLDAALWWLRHTDLELMFGSEPSVATITNRFIEDVGLDEHEVKVLFEVPDTDTQETAIDALADQEDRS